jgi:capsular polysaccharide biosynthesis protein
MNVNEKREQFEIDLKRVLLVLWSRAWIILLAAVLAGSLALGYAWFFIAPTYSASVQIYVNNNYGDAEGISSAQLTAAQDLAYTYMVILESRKVLDDVAKQTDLGYTTGQIKSMIKSEALNGTEVFQVTVTNTNYKHAAAIANGIAEVLPDKISAVVDGSSVRVVDYAVENPNPVGPNYNRYIMLGTLVGFVLCALIVIIADLADTTIKSEDYLVYVHGNLPLLAVIPTAQSTKSGYYKGYYEYSHKSESHNKSGGEKA